MFGMSKGTGQSSRQSNQEPDKVVDKENYFERQIK